jgi:hypothetical protein
VVSSIAVAAALAILLGGKGEPGGPAPPRPTAEWPDAWRVLSPSGRGTSPAPPIVLLTPGFDGPVEATIEAQGRRFVKVTRARAFAWPEALPPLSPGASCGVRIAGAEGAVAAATYVRLHEFPRSGTMPRALGR